MLMAMLRASVAAHPAKPAIVCGEERISYEELASRVARCAGGLHSLGIGTGDCVAAALANGPEYVIAFLATAALRAIFLPLNPHYTAAELHRFILDGEPRIMMACGASLAACRATVAAMESQAPIIAVDSSEPGTIHFNALSGTWNENAAGQTWNGCALYLYTSGSTDTYKRVCCTQENLYYEALNFVETVGLTDSDTILCTIPLFHSYGIGNCLLDALYLGSTLVILEQSAASGLGSDVPFLNQCGRVAELIRNESVRFYPGVPYQFSVLAGLPDRFPIDFSGVRLCVSSSDVLPRRTYDRFLARYEQPIRSLYGSTEAGSIAIDCEPGERLKFGSLGKPLKNVTIEIHGPGGQAVAPGEEGEIWVKSPTLPPAGYDNRPELTAEAFCNGYYRAGDVGALDNSGRLSIKGRKQGFADIAGYKVDIGEVEEVLLDCPGVEEAAALAVSIDGMGVLIKATVVPKTGWREQDIRAYCRERMAFVKVPRIIELRQTLPRSSTGKILKSELGDVSGYLNRIRDNRTVQSLRQLGTVGPEQRRRLLRSIVRAQAAAVLGRPPGDVPEDRGFTELGMDSFASIELRARLEYLLERTFPETMTFDHPTVSAVVEFLVQVLAPAENGGLAVGGEQVMP